MRMRASVTSMVRWLFSLTLTKARKVSMASRSVTRDGSEVWGGQLIAPDMRGSSSEEGGSDELRKAAPQRFGV